MHGAQADGGFVRPQHVSHPAGSAQLGDGDGSGDGDGVVGIGDGEGSVQYTPQSAQSVPSWQALVCDPARPSSQTPSEAQSGIPVQSLLQMQVGETLPQSVKEEPEVGAVYCTTVPGVRNELVGGVDAPV